MRAEESRTCEAGRGSTFAKLQGWAVTGSSSRSQGQDLTGKNRKGHSYALEPTFHLQNKGNSSRIYSRAVTCPPLITEGKYC